MKSIFNFITQHAPECAARGPYVAVTLNVTVSLEQLLEDAVADDDDEAPVTCRWECNMDKCDNASGQNAATAITHCRVHG